MLSQSSVDMQRAAKTKQNKTNTFGATHIFPADVSVVANSVFTVTLLKITTANNENPLLLCFQDTFTLIILLQVLFWHLNYDSFTIIQEWK